MHMSDQTWKFLLQAIYVLHIGILIYTGINFATPVFPSSTISFLPASRYMSVINDSATDPAGRYAHAFEMSLEFQRDKLVVAATASTIKNDNTNSNNPSNSVERTLFEPVGSIGVIDSPGVPFDALYPNSFPSGVIGITISTTNLFDRSGLGPTLERIFNSTQNLTTMKPFFKSFGVYRRAVRDIVFGWMCKESTTQMQIFLTIRYISTLGRLCADGFNIANLFILLPMFSVCFTRARLNAFHKFWTFWVVFVLVIGFAAEIVVYILLTSLLTEKTCTASSASLIAGESPSTIESLGFQNTTAFLINACVNMVNAVAIVLAYHILFRIRVQEGRDEARALIDKQPPPNPIAAAALLLREELEIKNVNFGSFMMMDVVDDDGNGSYNRTSMMYDPNGTVSSMTQLLSEIILDYREFEIATALISLKPHWVKSSRLRRYTTALSNKRIPIPDDGNNFNKQAAVWAVIKGFRVSARDAATLVDPVSDQEIVASLRSLFEYTKKELTPEQRRAFCTSLQVLADFGHADELNALLSQVVDRAARCDSAKQHAVNALILAAGQIVEKRHLQHRLAEMYTTGTTNEAHSSPGKGFLRTPLASRLNTAPSSQRHESSMNISVNPTPGLQFLLNENEDDTAAVRDGQADNNRDDDDNDQLPALPQQTTAVFDSTQQPSSPILRRNHHRRISSRVRIDVQDPLPSTRTQQQQQQQQQQTTILDQNTNNNSTQNNNNNNAAGIISPVPRNYHHRRASSSRLRFDVHDPQPVSRQQQPTVLDGTTNTHNNNNNTQTMTRTTTPIIARNFHHRRISSRLRFEDPQQHVLSSILPDALTSTATLNNEAGNNTINNNNNNTYKNGSPIIPRQHHRRISSRLKTVNPFNLTGGNDHQSSVVTADIPHINDFEQTVNSVNSGANTTTRRSTAKSYSFFNNLAPQLALSHTFDFSDIVGAHRRLMEIIDDFLDDFKLKAFSSAMLEPARFYFHLRDSEQQQDAVPIHGINYYLQLIQTGLGFGLPIAAAKDNQSSGFANFWSLFDEKTSNAVWKAFSDPENFGKTFETLKNEKRLKGLSKNGTKNYPRFANESTARFRESILADADRRKSFAVLEEKFAHFFSYDFFVPKMLSTLNSEVKPEHSGFRIACSRLFEEFQRLNLDRNLAPKSGVIPSAVATAGAAAGGAGENQFEHSALSTRNPFLAQYSSQIRSRAGTNTTITGGEGDLHRLTGDSPSSVSLKVEDADENEKSARSENHQLMNNTQQGLDLASLATAANQHNLQFSSYLAADIYNPLSPASFVAKMNQSGDYEDFDDWCFDDDYYLEMNVDRVAMFFAWLGMIKPIQGGSNVEQHMKDVLEKKMKNNNSSKKIESQGQQQQKYQQEENDDTNESSFGSTNRTAFSSVKIPTGTSNHEPIHSGTMRGDIEMQANSDAVSEASETLLHDTTRTGLQASRTIGDAIPAVYWPKRFPLLSIDAVDREASIALMSNRVPDVLAGSVRLDASSSAAAVGSRMASLRQTSAQVFDSTCPICLETRFDIEPVKHASSVGDTLSHRLCGECRDKYTSRGTSCPFCREAVTAEKFVGEVNRFAALVGRLASHVNHQTEPSALQKARALYDAWDAIESEYPDQILLERNVVNILKDPRCGGMILRAAQNNAPWLRHITGIVFRFHGFVADRKVDGILDQQIDEDTEQGMMMAVDQIIEPFVHREEFCMNMNGYEWANIVNQALSALLSAHRSRLPITAIRENVLILTRAMIAALYNSGNEDPGDDDDDDDDDDIYNREHMNGIPASRREEQKNQVKSQISTRSLKSASKILWGSGGGALDEFSIAFGIDL